MVDRCSFTVIKKSRLVCAVCAFLCLYSLHGYTANVSYAISWTGSNGYSMTGDFSFDDSLLGGIITALDLTSLSIQGFLNGVSVGSFSGVPHTFNFDSAADLFVVDFVNCSGLGGQAWGDGYCGGSGFGFVQGSSYEAMYRNGMQSGSIFVDSTTLTATLVPLPVAAWLFGSGLLALIGIAGKKNTA